MYLSRLQRFILEACLNGRGGGAAPSDFYSFYKQVSRRSVRKTMVDTVNKSLDHLVDRGFLIAYGRRTAERFFVDRVRLTPLGRRVANTQVKSKQNKLPLR